MPGTGWGRNGMMKMKKPSKVTQAFLPVVSCEPDYLNAKKFVFLERWQLAGMIK